GFHLDKQQLAQSALFLQLPLPPSGEQPEGLLNKRPDLMAAAANVQAKAAAVASAKADFLPRFDLRFLWQTGRIALLTDLDGWGSIASFGVQLPIFTAGKIRANVNAKDAALKTALLEYNHAILQALAEVDNRYQLQYALTQQVSEMTDTVDNNQQREVSIQKLFKYGDKTLDDVIRVQLETLKYQQELLAARLASGLNLIALYKAIGSGWSD
ncbi:MAG: outer membrane protein, partial [Gammaproteobacteria bacterium]